LHEFEFIKNKIKIGEKITDVYWIGYLFVKENASQDDIKTEKCDTEDIIISLDYKLDFRIKEVLKFIQVGGERNYGLGRLKLRELTKNTNNKIFEKFDLKFNDENPILKNSDIAIAHVKLNGLELELGEIEPIVGLEWSDRGAGQKVSKAKICATPGSKLKSCNFILCNYGILKAIKTL